MDRAEFARRVLAMENRLYRVSRVCSGSRRIRWTRCRRPSRARGSAGTACASRSSSKPGSRASSSTPAAISCAEGSASYRWRNCRSKSRRRARTRSFGTRWTRWTRWSGSFGCLYYMEGYRIREVAQILELSEGTVKSRLARAKRELRRLLDGEEGRA